MQELQTRQKDEMKARSAGAVIFRQKPKLCFLLLHSRANAEFWDFPKGIIEQGENAEKTARREIIEETGITQFNLIKGFQEKINWFYKFQGETIFKEVTYFLAETKQEEITLSEEHVEHIWTSYEKALILLKFKNNQEVLKKANAFIKNSLNSWIK